jgi:nicotinamidase-related amidase
MSKAHGEGVRDFIMVMDRHSADTAEFSAWPPHCLAGTSEAELPDALTELPFSDRFTLVPKDSLCAFTGTSLDTLVAERGLPGAVIGVGDCTDLCVYQLAMGFKLRANVAEEPTRVIVPADCVATFDVPVETAERIGALPHPGDLMHSIFLYHLALNDCDIVQGVVD